MKPLFSDIIEIDSLTPPRALTKLARAGICVYDVERKSKTCLRMRVKSKETQKIFAIFSGSCYTVREVGCAGLKKPLLFMKKRWGLLLGAAIFLAAAFVSQAFVLKIDVVGSGSHYEREAVSILGSAGLKRFSLYSRERADEAERALMRLPSVSFCSVEKSGSVLTVTLEENAETPVSEREKNLFSPIAGRVESVAVVRGTALVSEGDEVSKGQILIAGYALSGEGENAVRREVYPVGRVSLLAEDTFVYRSEEKSESALEKAYAAALIGFEGEAVEQAADVSEENGIYIYTVRTQYRRILSVNFG